MDLTSKGSVFSLQALIGIKIVSRSAENVIIQLFNNLDLFQHQEILPQSKALQLQ